jgi:hypothetical protein
MIGEKKRANKTFKIKSSTDRQKQIEISISFLKKSSYYTK